MCFRKQDWKIEVTALCLQVAASGFSRSSRREKRPKTKGKTLIRAGLDYPTTGPWDKKIRRGPLLFSHSLCIIYLFSKMHHVMSIYTETIRAQTKLKCWFSTALLQHCQNPAPTLPTMQLGPSTAQSEIRTTNVWWVHFFLTPHRQIFFYLFFFHFPTCSLQLRPTRTRVTSLHIRLHTARSGATPGFLQLSSHMRQCSL